MIWQPRSLCFSPIHFFQHIAFSHIWMFISNSPCCLLYNKLSARRMAALHWMLLDKMAERMLFFSYRFAFFILYLHAIIMRRHLSLAWALSFASCASLHKFIHRKIDNHDCYLDIVSITHRMVAAHAANLRRMIVNSLTLPLHLCLHRVLFIGQQA